MTNPIADDVFFLLVVKILKNVSCEYNRWVVERKSGDNYPTTAWSFFFGRKGTLAGFILL